MLPLIPVIKPIPQHLQLISYDTPVEDGGADEGGEGDCTTPIDSSEVCDTLCFYATGSEDPLTMVRLLLQ